MSENTNLEFERLFRASPEKILVIKPYSFEIVAVTDAYLLATMTRESQIIGKTLFEVFPDDPSDGNAEGAQKLLASLERIQSLKKTDVVGVLRYPIRRPNGSFEERFWNPVNSPVLDDAGDIEFIMHRVEDVTAIVSENNDSIIREAVESSDPNVAQDIISRSRELREALSQLQEYQARMRTAERLLNLGAWELNIQTGDLHWSEKVFDIYGVPDHQGAPNVEEYFANVHPEDREVALAVYADFEKHHLPQIEFEHRVIDQDQQVRYVKGVGERHQLDSGDLVIGYVQDITPLISTRKKLSRAERMVQLAGEKAQLGGWRVDLETQVVTWTPETAVIHDMPPTFSPESVDEAIQFYLPEYRDVIADAFDQCVRLGKEFDVICRLQTPKGRQPWVRSIGTPERDSKGNIVAVEGAFQDITTLHEAQIRADEAERRRLDVLESISDAFFALDKEWNFTYLNNQSSILLERPVDELLGKNVWTEFPEAVGSLFEEEYQIAVETKQTRKFQAFYPPLGKWFDVSAYPIPEGLAVYFRDVTGEREDQEQLMLVDAALSRLNDIVMITTADELNDPDGPRIIYVNDSFEQLTGYTKEEAIGNTPRILQGPKTDRKELDRIRDALLNREHIRCEVLNYKKTGEPYWLELDITPLFNPQGECTHFVAVERDITGRKQRELELRQAQERFQLISYATNDVIWDWDIATDKIWWNDSMAEMFGYQLSELGSGLESWKALVHPDDTEKVLESLYSVMDSSKNDWQCEYRLIKKDGETANVIDRGFIIRDDNCKAIRMVGSLVDITERIDMEERLRESQKLEAVGHLTGGVAHDFNNLLTVILGNAETLVELADPKLKPMAEMTVSAAMRGADLTSRLLAFARRQPLDPKLTDLNQLVEAMHKFIRRILPENIELEFDPEPDLGITEIDAGELDAALLNLIVNARDAMPNGGKLTIETANAILDTDYADRHSEVSAGEYVMISISDTGTGMTSETLDRVFEPFFTTKSKGKGSGLGLSMVFGFTKQSGGHIKVYSELDEGTTVKLYFPKADSVDKADYQPSTEVEPEVGTEHILIVEDDDLVLQNLDVQLRSLGYRVTAVMSGQDALKALKENSDIDLLFTDIIMPGGMNGRELADQALGIYPSLKVLYTSGYTENAIVHHGRLNAGLELLSKPYSRLELATKVRKVLDKDK